MQDDKTNYLSDEDLQSLIQSVEQEGMLHAPQYMKESILNQIQTEERVSDISSHRSNNVQLITYTLKVGVAMAAAIALIVLVPVRECGSYSDEDTRYERARYEEWLDYQSGSDKAEYEENREKEKSKYLEERKSMYDTTNEISSNLLNKVNKIFGVED